MKLNKSTIYKAVKALREQLTASFKVYQEKKDASLLRVELEKVVRELNALIDLTNE